MLFSHAMKFLRI